MKRFYVLKIPRLYVAFLGLAMVLAGMMIAMWQGGWVFLVFMLAEIGQALLLTNMQDEARA